MVKSSNRDADIPSAPTASTVLLLLGTVGDTTWRLFIPAIGGTVLGLWVDNTYDTTPWATVIGVLVGCAVAVSLVYMQVRKVSSK